MTTDDLHDGSTCHSMGDQDGPPHFADILYHARGEAEAMEWLARNPVPAAELTYRHPGDGSTALTLAVRKGMVAVTDALLQMEAPVDAVNNRGDTPLHWACLRTGDDERMVEVVEALLASGADPNMVGDLSNTPLHLAAAANSPFAVELLLMFGAEAEHLNKYRQAPLALTACPACRKALATVATEGELFRQELRDKLDEERAAAARSAASMCLQEEEAQERQRDALLAAQARRAAEDAEADAAEREDRRRLAEEQERGRRDEEERLQAEEEKRRFLEDETKRNKRKK